jgi:hypothetical protein
MVHYNQLNSFYLLFKEFQFVALIMDNVIYEN